MVTIVTVRTPAQYTRSSNAHISLVRGCAINHILVNTNCSSYNLHAKLSVVVSFAHAFRFAGAHCCLAADVLCWPGMLLVFMGGAEFRLGHVAGSRQPSWSPSPSRWPSSASGCSRVTGFSWTVSLLHSISVFAIFKFQVLLVPFYSRDRASCVFTGRFFFFSFPFFAVW